MARQRATSNKPAKTAARRPAAKTKAASTNTAPPKTAPQQAVTSLRSDNRSKFTLFNLLGKERGFYVVDRVNLERPADTKEKSVAHSIIIIDRSGSMTPYMEDLKDTLLKLLTLDEYRQYDMLVTLLSYSSQGDLLCHFQRAPIQEIMKRDSKQQKEIKKIHTTGLTCISQALQLAGSLVKEEEMTAITLHSDGYANHPSATGEAKTIEKLCTQMEEQPVFINTIAYSNYSDFRLLSRVANAASGTCIKAGNIKEVYSSLYSTSKLLGGSVSPPVEEPLSPQYDYQVFVSHRSGKILGAAGPLHIRGLKADDDAVVYKYQKVTQQQYKQLKDVPEAQTSEPVVAFARANLAEGNLNTAKYALASTFDQTLLERHGRALTNLEVADFTVALESLLFQPAMLGEHEVLDHVPVNKRIALLALVDILEEHRQDFTINLDDLKKNYVRKGLRRVQGQRDENGKLVEPWLKTEFVDSSPDAAIQSFDINRNTATMNMLISRRVRLVDAKSGKAVASVAGIKLDNLTTFNNYTLVSDGELNVPMLKIKISNRQLFDRLVTEGVLELDGQPATSYNAKTEYTLKLDHLPLVPPLEGAIDLKGVFEELAQIKVLSSLLAAHLKEESDQYTPEQVEELKRHYLSKNLYINFPTTTEYTDLQQALSDGSVDTRTSYKIDIGSRTILNLSKVMSANKFLDRIYEVTDAKGQRVDKPTFEGALDGGWTYGHKQLSARTRITAVDEFMRRLFDDFLGLTDHGAVSAILERVGAAKLRKILQDKGRGSAPARAAYVAALVEARGKLDAHASRIFGEKLSPLVFYIGSTGTLPDEMDVKAETAEQLSTKYPDLALSKDEQEGTFFEIGDTILSVYAKTEYFSK
jgi:Mg-chelatase subunit ChlD